MEKKEIIKEGLDQEADNDLDNLTQIAELENKVGFAVQELREILKVYHYKSDNENMSKDVVTSLENLLGQLLEEQPKKEESNQLEFNFNQEEPLLVELK